MITKLYSFLRESESESYSKYVTCEYGAYLFQGADGALSRVLADGDLHEEEGQAAEEKHDEVGDQEGAAAGLTCKSCSLFLNA